MLPSLEFMSDPPLLTLFLGRLCKTIAVFAHHNMQTRHPEFDGTRLNKCRLLVIAAITEKFKGIFHHILLAQIIDSFGFQSCDIIY